MDTKTGFEQRLEERRIIKEETRITMIIGFGLLLLSIIYGVAAYYIKVEPVLTQELLENVYGFVNIFVVMLMIGLLAIRKTIYYSPKLIKENFTVTEVLQRWRKVDIILLAVSELIPICGLVMTFLGMPFDRNFHFFLTSGLLIIILMPMGIKVRSKLSILRNHFPEI